MNESEVQVLRAEFQGFEKRVFERFDRVDEDFAEVKGRLKAIENELHGSGNGKTGVVIRLDRLEKAKSVAFWVICLFASALLAGGIAHYFSLIEQLIGK